MLIFALTIELHFGRDVSKHMMNDDIERKIEKTLQMYSQLR